MSSIPKFKGADWGQVEGKPVAYVRCDRERDRYHSGLEGSIVEIASTEAARIFLDRQERREHFINAVKDLSRIGWPPLRIAQVLNLHPDVIQEVAASSEAAVSG